MPWVHVLVTDTVLYSMGSVVSQINFNWKLI